MHVRTKHLLIAALVFVAEVLIATTFKNVPFVRSYFGDFLVVILLYHLVKGLRDISPSTLAAAVFAFACAVEVSQYFHLADALGLRPGSVPAILLGNSFSWTDIFMYFLGCLTAYLVDTRFLYVPRLGQARHAV
jgi:hypothetical protein